MRSLSVIRLWVVWSVRWWRFERARRIKITIVISLFIIVLSIELFAGLKRGPTTRRASSWSRRNWQGFFRLMFLWSAFLFLLFVMLGMVVLILLVIRIVSILFRLVLMVQPRIVLSNWVEFRSRVSLSRRATWTLILFPVLLTVLIVVNWLMVFFIRSVMFLWSVLLFRLVIVKTDFLRTIRWWLMMIRRIRLQIFAFFLIVLLWWIL